MYVRSSNASILRPVKSHHVHTRLHQLVNAIYFMSNDPLWAKRKHEIRIFTYYNTGTLPSKFERTVSEINIPRSRNLTDNESYISSVT